MQPHILVKNLPQTVNVLYQDNQDNNEDEDFF